MTDLTLTNQYREQLAIVNHPIEDVLPSHFIEAYPNLIKFLGKYYEYVDGAGTTESKIHELFNLHDISAIDPSLLVHLEDQFLLGRTNFTDPADSRAALKINNTLYRSKGSKFSLEQFFRMFFATDVEVVYTKSNVFIIDESEIGAESQRYITDDKLYQTFALLIRTSLAFTDWKELYKLFVHPAGMYVGAEVSLVTQREGGAVVILNDCMPDVILDDNSGVLAVNTEATMISSVGSVSDMSGITALNIDSDYRIGLVNTVALYADITIEDMDKQYDNLAEIMTATSPTMDMDSGGIAVIGASNTIETMDQDHFSIYDSA
jgi:hypothetical protein